MTDSSQGSATKVPEVTIVFWILKIAATTLGETGGDTVTMTLNWGYLAGTALFLSLLVVLVRAFSGLTESAGFSLSGICDSTFMSNRHGGSDGQAIFSGLA
jgi:hypothetical protein